MIILLAIGAIAGWIAGLIMKGGGYGLITNIILGVLGSLVGGWLFDFLDIETGAGFGGSLITAVAGAIVVLWLAKVFNRK